MNLVNKIAFPRISPGKSILRKTIYNLTYEFILEIMRKHPKLGLQQMRRHSTMKKKVGQKEKTFS